MPHGSTEGLMYEEFQNVPPRQRPRALGLLADVSEEGLIYFRKWRTLRWFLLFAEPGLGSAAATWCRGHGLRNALAIGLVGLNVLMVAFVSVCAGMASSIFGTYFRNTEPVRYWTNVIVLSVAYVAICCTGFLW